MHVKLTPSYYLQPVGTLAVALHDLRLLTKPDAKLQQLEPSSDNKV